MIPIEYFILSSFALFSIGLAGVAATRHFLIMIISMEVAIVAATLLAAVYFSYTTNGDVMLLLFALWVVAAAEAIVLIAFYRYIAKFEMSMDVAKLSRLRD